MIKDNKMKMYNLTYKGFKASLSKDQAGKIDSAVDDLKESINKNKSYGLIAIAEFFIELLSDTDKFDQYIDKDDKDMQDIIEKMEGLIG